MLVTLEMFYRQFDLQNQVAYIAATVEIKSLL